MNFTNKVYLRESVDHIREAIERLESHADSFVCPIADWLVNLKQIVIEIEEQRKSG